MKTIFLLIVLTTVNISAEMIDPLPDNDSYNLSKAALGKRLFYESGLSQDGTLACVSCHHLPGSGADTTDYSSGVKGQKGDMNAPSVLNARYNFVHHWDGRAQTLKDQVRFPVSNPKEMASSMKDAAAFLKSRPDYVREFKRIYSEGISEDSIADAIAEFEKALVTPNSRYDRYLKGETWVLSPKELQGKRLFYDYGCISCHNGINIGGNMYQKIGIFSPYHSNKGQLGRYALTQNEKDRSVFRVPSLRNVALTAPYFHDGKIPTLRLAIISMGVYQLGVTLSNAEVEALEAFLKTFTGETPKILREKTR